MCVATLARVGAGVVIEAQADDASILRLVVGTKGLSHRACGLQVAISVAAGAKGAGLSSAPEGPEVAVEVIPSKAGVMA